MDPEQKKVETVEGRHANAETNDEKVQVVVGTWKFDNDGVWTFKVDGSFNNLWVNMKIGQTLRELKSRILALLNMDAHNTLLRLAYKYPEWLTITEGRDAPPQYIYEDTDITLFVTLRRAIEDVNLYVSYSIITPAMAEQAVRDLAPRPSISDDTSDSDMNSTDSSDEDYHDFAMVPRDPAVSRSLIGEFNASKDNRNVIPQQADNISIPPAAATLEPTMEQRANVDKGKGVAHEEPESSAFGGHNKPIVMMPTTTAHK